ncbi:MAG: endonuclease/exonuclease/phosphatase family protein [Clostridia bacterium]|nr:endonuclease/exonuclease/phosphatase family protein [Clostridia bacterium]
MKKIIKTVLISLLCLVLAAVIVLVGNTFLFYPYYNNNKQAVEIQVENNGQIKMMSYNLRCISPTDWGKKAWFYRANLVIDDIENEKPGIIGFQESTKWHYKYLVDTLKGYDSVIEYRDEAFNSEGCPIFYNTSLYELVDKGSFWLSETPEVMSKSWGAQYNRVCSYVILTDKASGEDFVVFNTHLSHVSDEARINGIKVVLDKIAEFGSLPSVIMGDFNALEGSVTYNSVTENFLDAKKVAEKTSDSHTYQNWGNPEKFQRIDYFMVSKTGFKINSYDVLSAVHDGVYSSDHCPIVLEVEIEK